MPLTFSPDRLRSAREQAGLSQSKAARVAGVARGTVQNAEGGRNAPMADVLARMADAYGVSIDSLFVHDTDAATPDEPRGVPGTANTEARAAVSPDSTARAR